MQCDVSQKVVSVAKMLLILLLLLYFQLADSVLSRYVPSLRVNLGQRSRIFLNIALLVSSPCKGIFANIKASFHS